MYVKTPDIYFRRLYIKLLLTVFRMAGILNGISAMCLIIDNIPLQVRRNFDLPQQIMNTSERIKLTFKNSGSTTICRYNGI